MNQYIFGYGSLINLDSLSKTMNRTVGMNDIIPVKAFGYKRLWNLKEQLYSDHLQKAVKAIFLNIKDSKDSFINGILFGVSAQELNFLLERERNYACLEVGPKLVPYKNHTIPPGSVKVFMATAANFVQNEAAPDFFVMQKYIDIVESGCAAIGQAFLEDYFLTTAKNTFPVLAGNYSFQQMS